MQSQTHQQQNPWLMTGAPNDSDWGEVMSGCKIYFPIPTSVFSYNFNMNLIRNMYVHPWDKL